MRRLLVLRARRPIDALFAMEEALKCRGLASVIAELPDDSADLTATRRLSLAARAHDGLGLLLRHRSTSMPSAAMTRWEVAAIAGERDPHGGIGATAFQLSLVKNRRGPCGAFRVAWSHDELAFVEADPVAVAAPSVGRPADTAIA
jgi:protein ImuA